MLVIETFLWENPNSFGFQTHVEIPPMENSKAFEKSKPMWNPNRCGIRTHLKNSNPCENPNQCEKSKRI
tara:strand:+ start:315 stop:521 length:207 start_codon:yes stop_codon:yes gene_type:complete